MLCYFSECACVYVCSTQISPCMRYVCVNMYVCSFIHTRAIVLSIKNATPLSFSHSRCVSTHTHTRQWKYWNRKIHSMDITWAFKPYYFLWVKISSFLYVCTSHTGIYRHIHSVRDLIATKHEYASSIHEINGYQDEREDEKNAQQSNKIEVYADNTHTHTQSCDGKSNIKLNRYSIFELTTKAIHAHI